MNAAEKAMQDIGEALDAYIKGDQRELRVILNISRIVGRYDIERIGETK